MERGLDAGLENQGSLRKAWWSQHQGPPILPWNWPSFVLRPWASPFISPGLAFLLCRTRSWMRWSSSLNSLSQKKTWHRFWGSHLSRNLQRDGSNKPMTWTPFPFKPCYFTLICESAIAPKLNMIVGRGQTHQMGDKAWLPELQELWILTLALLLPQDTPCTISITETAPNNSISLSHRAVVRNGLFKQHCKRVCKMKC